MEAVTGLDATEAAALGGSDEGLLGLFGGQSRAAPPPFGAPESLEPPRPEVSSEVSSGHADTGLKGWIGGLLGGGRRQEAPREEASRQELQEEFRVLNEMKRKVKNA